MPILWFSASTLRLPHAPLSCYGAPIDAGEGMPHDLQPEGTFSAPIGRYVQLELSGAKHRIYFEEGWLWHTGAFAAHRRLSQQPVATPF